MKRVHQAVITAGAVFVTVVAVAYVLEGVGLAAIAAVGLFVVYAAIIPPIVIVEEELHLPLARKGMRH